MKLNNICIYVKIYEDLTSFCDQDFLLDCNHCEANLLSFVPGKLKVIG